MPVAAISSLDLFVTFWCFALGCAVGSFANVCIWRLPRGMTVFEPSRSVCPHCGSGIGWYDNIPLLSYLALGARCRHCRGAISFRYPLVEGITGVVFAALYARQAVAVGTEPGQVIIMALVASLLIVASGVDMQFLVIPDEVSMFGFAGGLLAGLLLPGLHVGEETYHTFGRLTGLLHLDGLLGSLIGAAVGAGIVLVFAVFGALIFRKQALGIGDVKLMAMIGAFMGWKVALLTFFVAPFFGLMYGIPVLVLKDEHVMPFGPFLSGAAVLVMVFRTAACRQLIPFERILWLIFGG